MNLLPFPSQWPSEHLAADEKRLHEEWHKAWEVAMAAIAVANQKGAEALRYSQGRAMAPWIEQQRKHGRAECELTWENFFKESRRG